ncbi:hypothetical protein ACWDUX_15760 [Streptomyces sp. NPDC003444]
MRAKPRRSCCGWWRPALDAAAKRLLDDPDAVPPGLSREVAAGWQAGRAAAVLDLLA